MKALVPIDGSDCGYRALEFAAEFVQRYDGTLHVVHITDYKDESTRTVLYRAGEIIQEAGLQDDPEVVTDLNMSRRRAGNRVGKRILKMVEEEGYDHIVMGHHGTGAVGRMLLGSAAGTIIRAAETPVSVIP